MSDIIRDIIAVLSTTGARWAALTSALPEELLARQPAPGEWSAAQCLSHLLDTESMVFPVRLHAFLEGKTAFDAFDPESGGRDYSGMTPAQLAAEFARYRTENLALLEQVTSDLLWRQAHHAEFGPVSLGEMLNEWASHDLNHTVQAERTLMQPFIAGSGPWRYYFADHDLGI